MWLDISVHSIWPFVEVDLIVVWESSGILLESVLNKAGHAIKTEYLKRKNESNLLLLDNGLLRAKILVFKAKLFEHILNITATEQVSNKLNSYNNNIHCRYCLSIETLSCDRWLYQNCWSTSNEIHRFPSGCKTIEIVNSF